MSFDSMDLADKIFINAEETLDEKTIAAFHAENRTPIALIETIISEGKDFATIDVGSGYSGSYRGYRFNITKPEVSIDETSYIASLQRIAQGTRKRKSDPIFQFEIGSKPGNWPYGGLRFTSETNESLSEYLEALFYVAVEKHQDSQITKFLNLTR